MSEKTIGELNEHTLHLALKNYIDPDISHHEISVQGSICDVVNDDGITEIETRSFSNLSKKLVGLLKISPVTVVFPIGSKVWVRWIDQESGEISERKPSTKKGRASDVIPELYKIRGCINQDDLTLRLIFIEEESFKRRIGTRRSIRSERVPISFLSEQRIKTSEGIRQLFSSIPEDEFTSKDFAKANKLRGRAVWYGLQLLMITNEIERVGKKGNAFIYRLKASSS